MPIPNEKSSMLTDRRLVQWLEQRFGAHDFRVVETRSGMYGIVFIMESDAENLSPRKFALKTFNPERVPPDFAATGARRLFERELGIWIKLPAHRNVLPALGLEFGDHVEPAIPLVRMPYRESCLKSWIDAPNQVQVADKLIALAQACNGLRWMYENGVEGHGDLTPSNILIGDLRETFELTDSPEFPSRNHPWLINIADLGWANIWRDVPGQTMRGARPYMAPERYCGEASGAAADVFSLAIIAAELLQGFHPTGQPLSQLQKWRERKWRNWSTKRARELGGVQLHDMRVILEACLSTEPQKRPSVDELQGTICDVLRSRFGLEHTRMLLDYFQQEATRDRLPTGHEWAVKEVSRLSPEARDKQISILEQRLANESLVGILSAAEWFTDARALTGLLGQRGEGDDQRRAGQLAVSMLNKVVEIFDDADLVGEFYGEIFKTGRDPIQPEEVVLELGSHALQVLEAAGMRSTPEVATLKRTFDKKMAEWTRREIDSRFRTPG